MVFHPAVYYLVYAANYPWVSKIVKVLIEAAMKQI